MRLDTLTRVLRLAKKLNACEERPSARALATCFGVCDRTIKRDIAALKRAGWRVPPPQVNASW